MNPPRPQQTAAPQMDSNPLQRALDNYLVMELQCEASRREAAELRTANARLVAEVQMLRERLEDVEIDRRKWEVTSSTLLGRLLAINDTIAGAVKAAVKSGLEATVPGDDTGGADAEAGEAAQSGTGAEATKIAPEAQASPGAALRVLATLPRNPM